MTALILSFLDAAWMPSSYPHTDGVCIYAGGDTPNPQAPAKCAELAKDWQYILPIWVRSDPKNANPNTDSAAFTAWLWKAGAPRGSLVALDVETAIDPAYVRQFYSLMRHVGYVVLLYGSQSDVMQNEIPDGLYWGADWTGHEHLANGDAVTQFASYRGYDESVAKASLPFWDTKAPKPTPPPAKPGTPPTMPKNLGVADVTPTSWRLSWALVDGADSYRVRVTYKGVHVWADTVTGTSVVITGRTPDHTYRCHVGASRGNVHGPQTNGPEVHTPRA